MRNGNELYISLMIILSPLILIPVAFVYFIGYIWTGSLNGELGSLPIVGYFISFLVLLLLTKIFKFTNASIKNALIAAIFFDLAQIGLYLGLSTVSQEKTYLQISILVVIASLLLAFSTIKAIYKEPVMKSIFVSLTSIILIPVITHFFIDYYKIKYFFLDYIKKH